MNILFVCTGNTCRSPMAEGIFNDLAGKNNLGQKLHAGSAGLSAIRDSRANDMSVLLLQRDGMDISLHRSQPVTLKLLGDSQLVLTMTYAQKEEMLRDFPESQGKVFTLKEFVGEKGDIHDPIGMGEDVYRETYHEIKNAVKKVFAKVHGVNKE